MMLKVIIFVVVNIFSVYSASQPLGNWILGQATYHDFTGSTTACERPFDNDPLPVSTFPFDRYAAVSESLLDADKYGCGKCYEIKCLSNWFKSPDCNCEGSSIIVEAIDKSGDQVPPHFDLNPSTFQAISSPLCGRLNITFRQVSCNYQTGIKITNMDNNLWYFQFRIDAVAGYGVVDKIEVKSTGSNTWNECTRSLGKWFCNQGVPHKFPLSMRFTQNGATNPVTATDVANVNTVGAVYWTNDNFILSSNGITRSPAKAVTPSPVASTSSPVTSNNNNNNNNVPVSPPYLVTYISNTVRTSDAEKLASWAVPGYAPDNDYNIVNFAFWTSPSFGGVGRGTNGFIWGCDGWETIGTYLTAQTRATLTGKSNPTDDEVRAAIVQRFHNAGKKLLVAVFGATDRPIQQGENAVTLGTTIGNIVKQYKFDGVDIDNEETGYLGKNGVGATWLCDLTNAIRAVLPKSEGYIISHAPQAPYFGTNYDYVRLNQLCGNNIDFYNVQYYNQGNERYNTYQYIFQQTQSWATGSNVYSYINTVGAEKIVIGKCTKNGGCGEAAFEMPGSTIHDILQTAINNANYPWSTGFMAWEFSGERNNNFELINAVSPLFPQTPTSPTTQAPTKVTPAPGTNSPTPPTTAPPIGVGGGPGCKSNKICIKLGGATTWWMSIYDPTNLSSGCVIEDCNKIEVRVGTSGWSIGYYDNGANKCSFDLTSSLSSTVSIDIKLTNNKGQILTSTNVIQSNVADSEWDFNANFDSCDAVTNSPVKSPTKSPVKSPIKSPVSSPTKSPVLSPTKSPVISLTDSPVKSPTSTGKPSEDIKIRLWYGSGDWYIAFYANFEDTIPDECSVQSVHVKRSGTSQWTLCGLSSGKYACSGRFAISDDISIDVKITVQNDFYLTGYGVITGYTYNSVYDFGTNFIGKQCTGTFSDNAITNAKVSAFDFSNYTAKNWGVFFSILIVLLLIMIGIVYLIYHTISKKKKIKKDVQMENIMQSTIQASEQSQKYNVPTPGGETQGNIQPVNDSDSDSPDGNHINNITMVTQE